MRSRLVSSAAANDAAEVESESGMWICPRCSEQHEDQFKECWKCAGVVLGLLVGLYYWVAFPYEPAGEPSRTPQQPNS
jgi:hypothetical protein